MRGSRFVGVVGRSAAVFGCATFELMDDYSGTVDETGQIQTTGWEWIGGSTPDVYTTPTDPNGICDIVLFACYEITIDPVGWSTDIDSIDISNTSGGGGGFVVWDTGGAVALVGQMSYFEGGSPSTVVLNAPEGATVSIGAGTTVTVCECPPVG